MYKLPRGLATKVPKLKNNDNIPEVNMLRRLLLVTLFGRTVCTALAFSAQPVRTRTTAAKSVGCQKNARLSKETTFLPWRTARKFSSSALKSSIPPESVDSSLTDEVVAQSALEFFFQDRQPYRSFLFAADDDDDDDDDTQRWMAFLQTLQEKEQSTGVPQDPVWELAKMEALNVLQNEPEAGPQIYQNILSQPSLLDAIVTIVSNEIETELIPATALRNLCLELLTEEDEEMIRWDIQAAAMRSPSVGNLVTAMLFHMGLHALVCYRVGHRLWQKERTGLAYYLQSKVSQHYSADIHPAATLGSAIYLCSSAGVVIGETAVCGDDVSILHGVTLGGTGKERGDRHPKVKNGVVLQDGATVLGNISVGDGAVVMAKSIVTKPVPQLARVSGVPAKIQSYRTLEASSFTDDLERHLAYKYLDQWKDVHVEELQLPAPKK